MLSDALTDFNRYPSEPVVIGDPSLDVIQVVSGVFHARDVTALTKALRGTFGITALCGDEDTVVLLPSRN